MFPSLVGSEVGVAAWLSFLLEHEMKRRIGVLEQSETKETRMKKEQINRATRGEEKKLLDKRQEKSERKVVGFFGLLFKFDFTFPLSLF